VVKPEERRPLETSSCRWKGNIKIHLREVRLGHLLDQSGSGQGQVAGSSDCGCTKFGIFPI
jgi:hypothetical protein